MIKNIKLALVFHLHHIRLHPHVESHSFSLDLLTSLNMKKLIIISEEYIP